MKSKKAVDIKWLYSFLLAQFGVVVVLFMSGLFPGGKYNLLTDADLYYQFATFGSLITNKIFDGSNFFYSFHVGMGNNTALLNAFYYINPFSIVFWFVKDIKLATTIILLLKAGAAAALFQLFCRINLKKSNLMSVAISLGYSIGSFYFYVLHMNVLYDSFYMLPFVLIMVEQMIVKNKSFPLVVGYIVLFFDNFYCIFIVGIASFFYFVVRIIREDNRIHHILNYIFSALSGLLVSSFYLFPAIYVVFSSSKTSSDFIYSAPSVVDLLKAFLPGNVRVLFTSAPVFYCGIITVVLAIIYFANKKIVLKNKIILSGLIFVLIGSYYIKPLYLFLHMFNNPDGYMGRFSVLIVFIICLLAVIGSDSITNKYLVLIIAVLLFGEVIYSGYTMTKSYQKEDNDYYDYSIAEADYVEEYLSNDKDIFRILYLNSDNINLSSMHDFMYLTSYSSAGSNKQYDTLTSLGFSRSDNLIREFGSTDIVRELLGVKYIVYGGNPDTAKACSINKCDYSLPLGYMINEEWSDNIIPENNSVFDNINSLIMTLTGIEDVLKPADGIAAYENGVVINLDDGYLNIIKNSNSMCNAEFVATGPENVRMYAYFDNIYKSHVWGYSPQVWSNKDIIRYRRFVSASSDPHIVEMDGENGEYKVNIVFEDYTDDSVTFDNALFYYRSEDLLKILYENLSENQLNIDIFEDGYVKGNVYASKDKNLLFLSIPYEKGWSAYVDGVESDIVPVYDDSFIGIRIPEGQHEIELKFVAPLSIPGKILSLLMIFVLMTRGILYLYKQNKNK